MDKEKTSNIKFLVSLIVIFGIIGIGGYFYQIGNKCNDKEILRALETLLRRDPKGDLGMTLDMSDYMPRIIVNSATRSYSEGDSEVCSAKVDVVVDNYITERINNLNSEKKLEDSSKLKYQPAINNISWIPDLGLFKYNVQFASDGNKVTFGNSSTATSAIQLRALLYALKNIDEERNLSNIAGQYYYFDKKDSIEKGGEINIQNLNGKFNATVNVYYSAGNVPNICQFSGDLEKKELGYMLNPQEDRNFTLTLQLKGESLIVLLNGSPTICGLNADTAINGYYARK